MLKPRIAVIAGMVTAFVFVGFTPPVSAQDQAPMPIHWTAALQSPQHPLQPGQKTSLALTADIDSGWHVYAFPQPPGSPVVPTEVTVPDGQALALSGDIKPPKAESQMDPTVGKQTDFYENSVTFDLPLKVAKKARAGKQSLEVDVRYQACNNRLCLPPRTDKVEAPVEIASRP
ncbi:MAG: protein-disulfide reductase DsbD domain-containing protein [Candidatus Acidiferrales bacterium]